MGARRKELARRPALREPRRRFTIVCEGKKTEPGYFGALKGYFRNALVEITIIGNGGDPFQVSETALRKRGKNPRRDSFEKSDEYWAVFDRDDFSRFDLAVDFCKENKIGCARSNPCFEIWLLYHVTDFSQPCTSKQAKEHWSHKSTGTDFQKLLKELPAAEARAKSQLRARDDEGEPFGCPSTTVHCLTIAIAKADAQSRW